MFAYLSWPFVWAVYFLSWVNVCLPIMASCLSGLFSILGIMHKCKRPVIFKSVLWTKGAGWVKSKSKLKNTIFETKTTLTQGKFLLKVLWKASPWMWSLSGLKFDEAWCALAARSWGTKSPRPPPVSAQRLSLPLLWWGLAVIVFVAHAAPQARLGRRSSQEY